MLEQDLRKQDAYFINVLLYLEIISSDEVPKILHATANEAQNSLAKRDLKIIQELLANNRCSIDQIKGAIILQQLYWLKSLLAEINSIRDKLREKFRYQEDNLHLRREDLDAKYYKTSKNIMDMKRHIDGIDHFLSQVKSNKELLIIQNDTLNHEYLRLEAYEHELNEKRQRALENLSLAENLPEYKEQMNKLYTEDAQIKLDESSLRQAYAIEGVRLLKEVGEYLADYDVREYSKDPITKQDIFSVGDQNLYQLLRKAQSFKSVFKFLFQLMCRSQEAFNNFFRGYFLNGVAFLDIIRSELLGILPTRELDRLQYLRQLQNSSILTTVQELAVQGQFAKDSQTAQMIVDSLQEQIDHFPVLAEFAKLQCILNNLRFMNENKDLKFAELGQYCQNLQMTLPQKLADLEAKNIDKQWLKLAQALRGKRFSHCYISLERNDKSFWANTQATVRALSVPVQPMSVCYLSKRRGFGSQLRLYELMADGRPTPSPRSSPVTSPRSGEDRLLLQKRPSFTG